jgi:hypothetical protein
VGVGVQCYGMHRNTEPGPGQKLGLGTTRHMVVRDLALVGGRSDTIGHMATPDRGLVKRAIPTVVDTIFMLGLSRYLGVLVPRGTDNVYYVIRSFMFRYGWEQQ